MAQEQATSVFDGQLDFTGGQDASKNPDKIAQNCVFSSINTTFKNDVLGPRSGFIKHELRFESKAFRDIFLKGKFQAFIPYSINNAPYLIIIISGIFYVVNQNTLDVTVFSLPGGDSLNEFQSRLNWSFAAKYIVVFDFPSFPVIFDGATLRRSDPTLDEVPISVRGSYNQSRLFVTNAANEFTGGDPTGSSAAPNAPITFLEVDTVGSPYFGQIFQLPTNYFNSPITAMGFLDQVDNSTGIGPLIIANANQIFAFNTQNPRSQWEQGQFGQVIVSNAGIAGQRSMVNVNSDLFFVSTDGQIRPLSVSRTEQSKWTKTPISREVKNWLKYSSASLAQFSTLTYFNNRIFCTANPYRVRSLTRLNKTINDYAFGGMVAIELDNVSTLSGSSNPVWAGLWTGIRPMDFALNDNRCFVMSKDEPSSNSLWEISSDLTYDKANNKIRYVKSTIYSRSYSFNDPFMYKVLNYVDMPIENIEGDLDITLKYKPSQSPNYLEWKNFKYKAPYRDCGFPTHCNFNGFAPHSLSELRIGAPENLDCNPATGYLYRWFRKVQLKIEIQALNWEMSYLKMKATTQPQADTDSTCEPTKSVLLCKDCDTDWVIPPFESCETKKET